MLKRNTLAVCGAALILAGSLSFTPSSNQNGRAGASESSLRALWAAEVAPSAASAIPQKPPARQIPVAPPPMGWSSWNSFSNTVDSNVVMQQTKAMVSTGMKKLGYEYINLDEGWWLGKRDENGNIVVEAKQWPALQPGEHDGDMSNIVRFIHSYGLKAGIYTDAGEAGCSFYGPDLGPPMPHTGSLGYYDQDFLQFAQWGFDYVKVDWCGGHKNGKDSLDPAAQYTAIAHSIERAERLTGHRLFYSICEWGVNSPWTWAAGIGGIGGDIWRVSGDIVDPIVANSPHSGRRAPFENVLRNFDQGVHPAGQHTGFYNDPDMMVVGMPGLSDAQNRVHMSLWAISGAPLLVGADLTKLDATTLGILTNPEIVAVDQDSLGIQAIKVSEPSLGVQVWTKPMPAAGEHAVMLLNRGSAAAQVKVAWTQIGLDPSASATVRDLWGLKDMGTYTAAYESPVAAGDAMMLMVRGKDAKATRYEAASTANEFVGGAALQPCQNCSSRKGVALGGDKEITFKIAPINETAYIQIAYINRNRRPLLGELSVNGMTPTNVLFPPTGEKAGAITLEVESTRTARENTLQFSSRTGPGPLLDSVSVLAGGQ